MIPSIALMAISMVLPLAHSLSTGCPIKWTSQQDCALATHLQDENEACEQTCAATHAKEAYICFLWPPEVCLLRERMTGTGVRVSIWETFVFLFWLAMDVTLLMRLRCVQGGFLRPCIQR